MVRLYIVQWFPITGNGKKFSENQSFHGNDAVSQFKHPLIWFCCKLQFLLVFRCQSLKLSECIRLQGDEIQKIDQLRKELRETKYQNIIIMEERDARIQELDELKKWAEALKTRFDVVERQKNTSIQKTEFVSSNCAVLQDTIRLAMIFLQFYRWFCIILEFKIFIFCVKEWVLG